jgi:hypothetical protein
LVEHRQEDPLEGCQEGEKLPHTTITHQKALTTPLALLPFTNRRCHIRLQRMEAATQKHRATLAIRLLTLLSLPLLILGMAPLRTTPPRSQVRPLHSRALHPRHSQARITTRRSPEDQARRLQASQVQLPVSLDSMLAMADPLLLMVVHRASLVRRHRSRVQLLDSLAQTLMGKDNMVMAITDNGEATDLSKVVDETASMYTNGTINVLVTG